MEPTGEGVCGGDGSKPFILCQPRSHRGEVRPRSMELELRAQRGQAHPRLLPCPRGFVGSVLSHQFSG